MNKYEDIICRLEKIGTELFNTANQYEGNAAGHLRESTNEILLAIKCFENGNDAKESIPIEYVFNGMFPNLNVLLSDL